MSNNHLIDKLFFIRERCPLFYGYVSARTGCGGAALL